MSKMPFDNTQGEKMGGRVELYHGDCLEEMKKLQDESIDTVLTDPPY